ncbi:MAG: bifunctional glutamate N-acetyltransferase/amino-acid acetyltransferase ArgJ [Methylococcales bacterium]|jgi:glutamate N-acetyltransferase / amino-acid N-acetyltransferase|nr:bifunctional glutamate N-acetyltransferase/amino-acid acetyltransferase ArgJ [Methylococcales bacterium]MBT7408581.1 bifunctional glutamate N-acetyltransferase/amino-acid acetyltransferase ArgJ [Methylococcales bacterium]
MKDNQASKLQSVKGIKIGVGCAGIKQHEKPDVVLFEMSEATKTVAVFTQNAFCAAPVVISKDHLLKQSPRYLLINSGNANAGTGQQGFDDALSLCQDVAKIADVSTESVLPFSTGVIGEFLPQEKMTAVIPEIFQSLSEEGWSNASNAIMTTDTVPKALSRQIDIEGELVTITGIAKGSGMICPNMATMLSYVATDVAIDKVLLEKCFVEVVEKTFNKITVDGDTSTNDSCLLMATGGADHYYFDDETSKNYVQLKMALLEVFEYLAVAIIKDGEGATKLVAIHVNNGATKEECSSVAYTVANSPLVKTALFAGDPNWGRILAAVGRSGIKMFDIEKVEIDIGDIAFVRNGSVASNYTEEKGQAEFSKNEIDIYIHLGRGDASVCVWTCDFSYDYVRINAEYRT